ncbi:hypothetical protein Agabi119p4_6103 [Agaricus bisporus var. burnettii]|uniref:Uncharacterized protein n=1 Tax=Agaricus bisporus var. burnettii TaxID=192524 RepID=A0A8H7F1A6_AGABI|nr:hypothetical protein Agabi119p4_6103 [Agaricus bisporus var. burnettii]
MAMHSELEEALNTGLSIPEVIRIFTKHHSSPKEAHIKTYSSEFHESVHRNRTFWDNWKPLFRRLPYYLIPDLGQVDEPFMSIHKALTREIISWLCDSKRRSNVYLISEPQVPTLYVNRNTRAHLLANACYDAERFGLLVQISPYSIWGGINSLIAQLAVYYPPYRRILSRELIDNPGIFELSTRTRFRKLIHEPWQALRESHPHYIVSPPVVILCWGSESLDDKELWRSIDELGSSPHSSPLLWIVSIDANIKLPIRDLLHPFPPFQYFRLPVCYNEGPADAALILHRRFSALRHKHKEMFNAGEVWPSEEQMSQLIRVVAGVFETVEVMIQFVDWEDDGGPKAHLETFLAYMVNSPSPSDERPYCALDHFYTRALSTIPPHILSVFKQAFGIVYYGNYPLNYFELELVCLFSFGQDTLLSVLPHAYRLVVVWTNTYGNPWFRRFLEDPARSGQFYTPPSESRLCAFQAFLHILRYTSNPIGMLKLVVQATQARAGTYCFVVDNLRQLACDEFGGIGAASAFGHPFSVFTSLRRFDFRCLASTCDKIGLGRFVYFLKWLYSERVNLPNIVRTEPVGILDRRFMDKCGGLAEPLDLEKLQMPRAFREVAYPKYVLLGFENETVLAVLAPRNGYDEQDRGVTIYTSTMLECI